jgi:hypothetical protein
MSAAMPRVALVQRNERAVGVVVENIEIQKVNIII